MKRIFFLAAALVALCSGKAQNPYLPLWEHLPDGEPRCFEDPDHPGKYRVYIIGSHDVRFTSYCGPDVHAWSAPVEDLNDWRDEGSIFTYPIDNQWDVMYAPDLVEVNRPDGKREYYLYPHSCGWRRIGFVAKSDRPMGPFEVLNATPDGRAARDGSVFGFDPSVFVEKVTDPADPDSKAGFRAYGFYGFQHVDACPLDPSTMWSKHPQRDIIRGFIPASHRYGVVKESEGTHFPHVFPGEDLGSFNFFEAASIRQVGNKYVWVFSGYSGPDYGLPSTNSALRYAYGDTPLGPWKSGGVLVDSRAVVPTWDGSRLITTYAGHNTHGSIEKVGDMWYCFYHRAPRGFGNARQAMVAPVKVEWDEAPVSEGGAVRIRAYDPFAPDNIHPCTASNGSDYRGAEVTSEGFNIYGLPPYQFYSAGYACYLSDMGLQSDSWDVWANHAPVTGVKNGNIIGFKYFGFGGLSEDRHGLKAFEGTQPGNGTQLCLWIAKRSSAPCQVEVWLDAVNPSPALSHGGGGRLLGTVDIPTASPQPSPVGREPGQSQGQSQSQRQSQSQSPEGRGGVLSLTLDVSSVVDRLDGKHAIYLVAKGGQGELFDLLGIGFTKKGRELAMPQTPNVQIYVNGKAVPMPHTPIRSTNQNGLTDQSHYTTTAILPASTQRVKVKAVSDNRQVRIRVRQQPHRAVVECTYRGKTKYYEVKY